MTDNTNYKNIEITNELLEEIIEKVVTRSKYNKGYIHIPIWLIGLILPLITAIIIGYGSMSSVQAEVQTKLIDIRENIQTLHKCKANSEKVDLILTKINTLETKLDGYINLQNQKNK